MTEEYGIPCPNCGRVIRTEKFCAGCGTANPINYIDESVKISKSRTVRRQEKRRNNSKALVAGIGVALSFLVGTILANSYALSSMQFRVSEVSDIDVASMSSAIKLDACNPTAFPAGFDSFNAVISYRQSELARVTVSGSLVMPYQSSTFSGEMSLTTDIISGPVLSLRQPANGQYDENEISVATTMDAKILGIVPYTQTGEYSYAEFQAILDSEQASQYSCD